VKTPSLPLRFFPLLLGLLFAQPSPGHSTPPSALEQDVQRTVAANPKNAPAIVTRNLAAGTVDLPTMAPLVAAAAIRGLPQPAGRRAVADIVQAAVKACPDAVLEIVRASVRAAPAAAEGIVAAAVNAVPDPTRTVTYAPLSQPATRDFKSVADGKTAAPRETAAQMTLAEAICHAAMESAPGLNFDALVAAADLGSSVGLDDAFRSLDDPRILTATGDAGMTSFGNEPHPPVHGPKPPPVIKPPPVVSP
jgi:hypothetical protein